MYFPLLNLHINIKRFPGKHPHFALSLFAAFMGPMEISYQMENIYLFANNLRFPAIPGKLAGACFRKFCFNYLFIKNFSQT